MHKRMHTQYTTHNTHTHTYPPRLLSSLIFIQPCYESFHCFSHAITNFHKLSLHTNSYIHFQFHWLTHPHTRWLPWNHLLTHIHTSIFLLIQAFIYSHPPMTGKMLGKLSTFSLQQSVLGQNLQFPHKYTPSCPSLTVLPGLPSLTDWLTDWLAHSLNCSLDSSLTHLFTRSLTHLLTHSLTHSSCGSASWIYIYWMSTCLHSSVSK